VVTVQDQSFTSNALLVASACRVVGLSNQPPTTRHRCRSTVLGKSIVLEKDPIPLRGERRALQAPIA
jgi:hypothetical protein